MEQLKIAIRAMRKMPVPADRISRITTLTRLHMQLCAVQSQQNLHVEAEKTARLSAKFAGAMICGLNELCKRHAERLQRDRSRSAYEDSETVTDSLLAVRAGRLFPVMDALAGRLTNSGTKMGKKLDMRCLFGYLPTTDWASQINISGLMQISPMKLAEMVADSREEESLALGNGFVLEKVAVLCTAYFCLATEQRFLRAEGEAGAGEGEFWHAKALEIASRFLPQNCLLATHILHSYQKHYSSLRAQIPTVVFPLPLILLVVARCRLCDETQPASARVAGPHKPTCTVWY